MFKTARRWSPAVPYLLTVLLLQAPLAHAVQDASVISTEASIYETGADGKSHKVQDMKRGDAIKVADQPKGEWYRCVIPGSNPPRPGWVQGKDIQIKPKARVAGAGPSTSTAGAGYGKKGAEKARSRSGGAKSADESSGGGGGATISAFFDGALISPVNFQAAAGLLTGPTLGVEFGAQWLRHRESGLVYGARADLILQSGRFVNDGTTVGDHYYSGTALPITALLGYRFIDGEAFNMSAVLGAGVSPITRFEVSDGTSVFTGSSIGLVGSAGLQGELSVVGSLSLFFEVGYRMIMPLSKPAITAGYSLGSDFNAPFGGAGLSYRF